MKKIKNYFTTLLLFAISALFISCGEKTEQSSKGNLEKPIVIAGYRDPGRGTKDPYFVNYNLYVWEPLIGESNKGDLIPVLATDWSAKEDGKVWTFNLRKGVKFSDGTPFNADVALENFERYKKLGIAKSTFFSFSIEKTYPGLLEVKKIDDYTIELSFEKALPTLPYTIVNFASHMVSPKCYNNETGEFKKYVVGTGPFKIKEHKENEYLALERNEDYYGERAKAKYITVKMIPEHDTRVMALRTGEIKGVYDNHAIKPLSALELKKEENFNVSSTLSANINYINVNHKKSFLANKDVRKAISMAVDREVLLKDIYGGFGKATNNLLTPFSVFHKSHKIVHDVDKAKNIIASYGDEIPKSLKIICLNRHKTDAELVSAWLKNIGLNTSIEVMEWKIFKEKLKKGDFDLAMSFIGLSNADPSGRLSDFLSSVGYINVDYGSGYVNHEADKLIAEMHTKTTIEERKEIYNKIQDFAVEELPIIPLFAIDTTVVSGKDIEGYNARWTGVTLPEVKWK